MKASFSLRETSVQPSPLSASAPVAPAQAKRVLLVEDDMATGRLTALILARAGFSVDTVGNGEAGWGALCAAPYDLLVTDNDLPRLTGMQLIERLRFAGLTLPVIITSGSPDLGEARDYPWLAVTAILHKPFPFSDLTTAARRAVPIPPGAAGGAVNCLEPPQDAITPYPFPARPDSRPDSHPGVFPERRGPAESPEPAPTRPASAPKRILVVDDDALVRASVAAVLDCEGYEVNGAADGEAALKSVVEHQPDLVLLDLNMPNMDGWTAFVRLEHVRPLMPVIVITARPHQYEHAVEFGVDAFMEKPLNFPVLLRAIRKLTHESEQRRHLRVTNPRFMTHLLDSHTSTDFLK